MVTSARRSAVLVCACSFVLFCSCVPTRPAGNSEAGDLAAIEAFNRAYLTAINAGDLSAFSALTTDGHVMIAPNRPPVRGRAAMVEAMGRAFEMFTIEETWTPVETEVAGDWAWQRGTYTVAAAPKGGGQGSRSTGNFLRIFRRQQDGSWRMVRDMFNSDQSPLPRADDAAGND